MRCAGCIQNQSSAIVAARFGWILLIVVIVADAAKDVIDPGHAFSLDPLAKVNECRGTDRWIGATDVSGKITRMNPQAEKLTGWTLQQAKGRPLGEVFHIINVKTGEPAFNLVPHVIKTGKILGLANDTTLIARDGTRRQIGDSAAPIRDSEGNILGAVIVFSNVTEQYKAREALRISEERYRTIVENINDALYILDLKGTILDLNESPRLSAKIFAFSTTDSPRVKTTSLS